MRLAKLAVCFFAGVFAALAQTDRGTITGTVTDATGAVIANAPIEAKNTGTGQIYPATSTATGNFTITQLPPGTYELSANVQGFKKYIRQNLGIEPTQTLRLDIPLEVGASTESVTVNADVTLLKTENGEVATNVTGDRLNNLPLLGIGEATASAAGIRNPWAVSILVPGVQYVVGGAFGGTPNIVVNGAAANSASYRIEGMDAGNNGSLNVFSMEVQPSAEAIQEVAVQTSNFSAEYGTVGGGLFNATMRSGTNAYHGSLYDYNVNEAYNAAQPYTAIRNKARRNDYGGGLGGPIWIPKIYNGRDKTFFYFNFEQYRESQVVSTTTVTVPTASYRIGDFSAVIPASGVGGAPQLLKVGTANYLDPLGRTVAAGTIFDPTTQRSVVCNTTAFPGANCVNGQNVLVRDPFVGNTINPGRFDTVAKNIQNLIPLPTGPGAANLGNNFNSPQKTARTTEIPSLKLDQTLGKGHLSFYWSTTTTADQFPIVGSPAQPEGFPETISTVIANFDYSYTMRLNYDVPLTPALLLHMGAGYQKNHLWDDTPNTHYDAQAAIGLKGATVNRNFPR
ncbi:MAG TPA: carboxypeptidase regulatory-like domain-containing protein, partial [Bryobacteraceae bacterium]